VIFHFPLYCLLFRHSNQKRINAARCPLPAARCPLPAARCPLPAARLILSKNLLFVKSHLKNLFSSLPALYYLFSLFLSSDFIRFLEVMQ
jgi:hypothetical protein